jgi:hypothetical protein
MLYAGPGDGSAAWQAVASIPCAVGQAQPDGQPAGALLGAVNAMNLIVACTAPAVPGVPGVSGVSAVPGGPGLQKKLIFRSADGGSSWRQAAAAPAAGVADSVAASPAGTVVLGTDHGIDVLPAGSAGWQQPALAGAPAGGFGFVGMTTGKQGIALPADATAGTVWFTFDAGQSWQPSGVSGS